MNQNFLSKNLPHIIAVVVIILINCIYFYPQLEGKKLRQGDILSSKAMSQEPNTYTEETGEFYLWNNGQMGGMPRLLAAPANNNLIIPVYKAMRLGFSEPIGLFIALMLLYYVCLLALGVNPYISLILSVTLGLSTDNLMLWAAGHNSKIRTLVFTPLIAVGFIYILKKHKYLLGGALLALGLGLSIYTRHPQMTYYIFLFMGVFGVIELVKHIKNKQWNALISSGIVIALATVLALGASASKMWSIYDYNKSSMRGKPVLKVENVSNTEATSSSQVDGLDWEYAMSWSNSMLDLMATYIPGFAGGGSGEKVGPNSASARAYRQERAPLYWGGLPFTEGPMYLGAILIFLFVFGLFYVKGDLKLWLGIAMLLMILLSMGKYFSILNKPLFDHLPLYNKFRTPQSVLSAAKFFLPILGALAITQMLRAQQALKPGKKSKTISLPDDFKKSLYWSTGICAGIALLTALLGPSLFSFEGGSDARYLQQGADITPFIEDRKSLMRTDAFRTFMLVALTAGAMWLFMKKRLQKVAFIGILAVLCLFDVWSVGQRYLSSDDFMTVKQYDQNFVQRPVDKQILAQEPKREGYRVLDLTVNTFNDATQAYWHNTIGGYHPAKLQRYQDVIERHISQNNQAVLDMLNTKYIIGKQGEQAGVQQRPTALGNAWFVDEVQIVSSPNEEIDALTGLNAGQKAVVLDGEFDNYIGNFDPTIDPAASIALTDYEPDHLTYQSKTSSEQLAVFSEVWYGPDKGWQAYLDGEPVPHIRANYLLRSLKVPAGEHTIEFKFHPKTYYTGETIALISSLLLLAGFAFVGFTYYREEKNKVIENEEIAEEPTPVRRKRKKNKS